MNKEQKKRRISIVVPFYQNSANVPDLVEALKILSKRLEQEVQVDFVVVDDGSTDDGYEKLLAAKELLPQLKLIKLTGNFGSYAALLAGLAYTESDCYAQLHADLQDPPEHIPEMVQHWNAGIKLVIGQRVRREERGLSSFFSGLYHKLMKTTALPHIPDGGYDLVLFDREIRDHVVAMNESNVNLIYLISWLRYPYVTIPVVRRVRDKGVSQWSFSKKVKLFVDSFVAFSYLPIKLVSMAAVLNLIVWIGYSIWLFAQPDLFFSILWLIYSVSSFILISLAIVAEYLWRTLEVSRKRPPFIVERVE
jgi:polyisoprenyl-phosphate glycosyltransferase